MFSPVFSFSQSIKGIELPDSAKAILLSIMQESGVEEVIVTSTNRTVEAQVTAMIELINKSVDGAKHLYGKEGKAVIDIYVKEKQANKTTDEIKQEMIKELKKQLPSAIANNHLMHVGRELQFIVFDISISKLKPATKINNFQSAANKNVSEGKIFRFLGTNSGEKDALHFEMKKSVTYEIQPPIKSKATPNSFYIFLTTTIEIKPKPSQFSNLQSSKTLYIILTPLLHQGNLTDAMQVEKELFITDIKIQLADKPDILKQLLSKDSKSFEVHYGIPYSTKVLKTNTEGYEAIKAYKNMTKETLQGLAEFDFYQLN